MVLAVAISADGQTAAPVKLDLGSPSKAGVATDPKAAPKQDVKKKKEEPPATIEGTTIARGTGFLGLQIVNGNFKLSFYDAKKKPVAPDVTTAVLRWNVNYQPGPERVTLTPGGGMNSLTSVRVIRQPYSFRVTLLLLKGSGDEADTETFQVDFSQ